jgi:hypothetical protein
LVLTLASACVNLLGQPVLPLKVNCFAPEQPQKLILSFAVETLTVEGTAGLHWRINPLPTEEDIQVSDPQLKRLIENWISEQNKLGPDPKNAWVIDGRSDRTFLRGGLNLGLSENFNIVAYPVVPPPSRVQPPVKLPVIFCAAHIPALQLEKLEIQVVSANYDPHKPNTAQDLSATLDPGVTGTALLSDEDTQSDASRKAVLNAFAKVAETAWQIAKQNGITIGSQPSSAVLHRAEGAITAIYNMAKNNIPFQFWGQWPEAQAIFQTDAGSKCCTLRIRNVQMAKDAEIRVEANLPNSGPALEEGKKSQKPDGITEHPAQIPEKRQSNNDQERADKLAQRSQEALKRRFAGALSGFANTVPTFAQIDALRSNFSGAREIYPTVRLGILETDHRVIVFDTDNRWTRLNVNLTVGGGYSAEQKATGKVDFQGENLIFQIPDSLDPIETESLSYTGGGQVQKADANWGLNWTHSFEGGAQATYGPQLSGNFSQNHNQRFGNVSGPLLRDHEIGWAPGFVSAYTAPQVDHLGNPNPNLFGLSTDVGLRQQWETISPATGNLFPPRSSGFITALYLDVTPGYHYRPANPAHVGGVDVSVAAHFLQGLPAGNFTFTQVQVSAQATVFFGAINPSDFFVRFRKGMGASNGATPLFDLFRLGGTDNTRGVEQGEQVAREIAFEQSEAGISAREIVSWFKRTPKGSPAEQTPKALPIDLTKIYLKGFYDRGRVTQTGSFADLFAFRHGAKGYGVAAEFEALQAGNKRITLSIGYARSPDSALHRSGVAITSASLDF